VPKKFYLATAGFLLGCMLVLAGQYFFREISDRERDWPKVEYQPEPKVYAPREDTTEVLYNVHVFFSNGYRVEYKPEGIGRVVVYADSIVSDSTRERLKHTNPFSLYHKIRDVIVERPGYGKLELVSTTRHSRLWLSEGIVRIDRLLVDQSRNYDDSIDLPRRWCKVEMFDKKVLFTKVDTLKAGRRSRW